LVLREAPRLLGAQLPTGILLRTLWFEERSARGTLICGDDVGGNIVPPCMIGKDAEDDKVCWKGAAPTCFFSCARSVVDCASNRRASLEGLRVGLGVLACWGKLTEGCDGEPMRAWRTPAFGLVPRNGCRCTPSAAAEPVAEGDCGW